MPDWQERITHETAPAIRAEHELRYRVAVPLILDGGPWADLGCGNGLAAASALGEARPRQALLVDVDPEAVAQAARRLRVPETRELAGDLTQPDVLREVGEILLSLGQEAVVTCFEVLEHLRTFLPLMEWANALARERGVTFLLSVPNDAFWSTQNPHHLTAWSEGAFQELLQLIPPGHTLMRQVALAGSTMVDWDLAQRRAELVVDVGGDGSVATHFIAAFGARHSALRPATAVVQTDMIEQRRWERQRESDAAVAQEVADAQRAAVRAQDVTIARQKEELQAQTLQFDAWRRYIHELERELGRPLSGGSGEREPDAQSIPDTPAPSASGDVDQLRT
jgi:hypothetical protein